MSFNNNIKLIRQALSMSQEAFGEIAGIRGPSISAWESGNAAVPRMSNLKKVAEYTGIPAADIMNADLSGMNLHEIITEHRNKLYSAENAEEPEPIETINDELDYSALKPINPHGGMFVKMLTDVASRLDTSDLQMLVMLATRLAEKDK